MNLQQITCASLLAAALIVSAACGGDDDGSASSSGSPTGTPRPTAPLNLPADFPEDFPLYPDISLDQSARFENEVLAVFSAADGIGDVATFYREKLAEEPWQILTDNVNAQGNVITISFKNTGEDIRGTVTLSEQAAGAGADINTTFIVPERASTIPTLPPTANTNSDTPTPGATEAG